jgi:hypothetical protein
MGLALLELMLSLSSFVLTAVAFYTMICSMRGWELLSNNSSEVKLFLRHDSRRSHQRQQQSIPAASRISACDSTTDRPLSLACSTASWISRIDLRKMPIQPSSRTTILRFKHHRSTILLHVDPLHSFASIKKELLLAITETNPSGSFNGHPIPQNSDEILLAKPVNPNDLDAGWTLIDSVDGEDASGKGKAKASTTSTFKAGGKAQSQLKDCPQGHGMRDMAVVAFKFKSESESRQAVVGDDDGDEAIEVADEDKREEWDVVVPTMEETYGDQVEEDVGDAVPI